MRGTATYGAGRHAALTGDASSSVATFTAASSQRDARSRHVTTEW